MSHPNEDRPSSLNVSRRSFVTLAVSALSTLPAVAGGFLLPGTATVAQAAEADDGAQKATDPARIVVVSPKQLGLYIADQADGSDAPIVGAHVVVTSLHNGKVLEDWSKDDGMVVFDIGELAEEELVGGVYAFNGTIDVTADGYREFHVGRTRLEGNTAISVPTRRLEPNRPYPSRLSLDGWDILYYKNGFVSTAANDADVPIDVEILNLDEKATLTLHERSDPKVFATVDLVPRSGAVRTSFSKKFLLQGTEDALPVGGEFFMQIETSDTIYEFPIALDVKPGFVSTMDKKENASTTPVNSTTTPDAYNVTIPNFVPYLNSQKLNMWVPNSQFSFIVDPFGYIYFAYKTPRIGYISDAGETDDAKWGVHSYESASSQYENFVANNFNNAFDTISALSKGSLLSHVKFTTSLTAALSARFTLAGKWDWGKGSLQGDSSLLGMLEVLFSMTEQFGLGPVPVYLSLTINANAAAALGAGVTATDALDFSTYDWDYTNTGLTVTINLMGSIAAGVGVAGLASIGARGTLGIMMYLGVTKKPDPALETPHAIIGFSGSAAVEIQFFLFKWSGVFWSFNEPNFKDNWKNGALGSDDPSAPVPDDFRLADGSHSYTCPASTLASSNKTLWETLFQDATPVTEAELAMTKEVRVTPLLVEEPTYDETLAVELPEDDSPLSGGILYPWDDAFSYDETALGRWEQEALNVPRQPNASLGVDHVDLEKSGVWPSRDVRLLENVFSDPRTKIVSGLDHETGGTVSYVFRIACVEVLGLMRTHLCYQTLRFGVLSPAVSLEFGTGLENITRADLFDYDFDVLANDDGTRLYLLLLSGVRPSGDATSPYDAFEELVFTYCDIDMSIGKIRNLKKHTWRAVHDNAFRGVKNAIFSPCLTHLRDDANGNPIVALSWLHRFVSDEATPLESSDAELAVGTAYACAAGIGLPPIELGMRLDDNTGYDLVTARGEGEWSDEVNLHYAIRGENGTTGAYLIVLPHDDGSVPSMRNMFFTGTNPLVGRLTQWIGEDHTGFLVAHDGKLRRALAVKGADVFDFTEVAPFEFNVNSFGLDPTGNIVYYQQGSHGISGYEYDDEGQATPIETHDNRVYASKLYKGAFSEPYVLANIGHTAEGIVFAGDDGEALSFLITAIDDFAHSSASVWYTAIPAVSTATVLGQAVVVPLVAAGDDASFLVTLRNDGNVHLTGATIELVDESGGGVSSSYIEFSEETLQPSIWNPPTKPGDDEKPVLLTPSVSKAPIRGVRRSAARAVTRKLINTGEDYELAPGKSAVYSVSLAIPKDWEGERQVTLRVKDTTHVRDSGLEIDENPVKLASTFNGKAELLQISNEANVDNNVDQDAPVTMRKKGGGEEPSESDTPSGGDSDTTPSGGSGGSSGGSGGSSGGSGSPTGGGASSGTTVPDTGEHSPITPLSVALGALGAGMVAYSARRMAVEQKETEE